MKKAIVLGALLAFGAAGAQGGAKDTIVVMGSSDFDPSTPSGAYLQEVARLYEAMNPDVKVQLNYGSWGDLWKKVGVMLGNRQGPDLVIGPRDYLMANGRGAGQWEDIAIIPEKEFLTDLQKKALGPALLEASRFPGRGYMVWPWKVYIDGTMVVNGDMLKAAGVNPLDIQKNGWTMDQFLEIARNVTKGDQYAASFGPMAGHNGDRIWQSGILSRKLPLRLQPLSGSGYTATYVDIKNGKLFLDTAGFLKGCNVVRQMLDRDKTIPKNTVGVSMDESRAAFVNGKTAFSFDGPDLINLVEERNRKIANGQEKGKPVDAYVVPRPHFSGKDYQPQRITALSYGYYGFKQNPYKGDAHARNVNDFARFFTNPVFQVRLAADNTTPPDARVYMGEQSWFPGMMGTGPNAKYVESLRSVWQPSMGIYQTMATTPELQAALQKFQKEVVEPTRDSIFLGKMSCNDAIAAMKAGLANVDKQVPLSKRLTKDAPRLAKELDDFAKQIGQPN